MYQSVLFVCTGNICRSPTAEGMLRQKLGDRDLRNIQVDSAGIHGFHAGSGPDIRAVQAAVDRGYTLDNIISRPVCPRDFSAYELMIGMDRSHVRDLVAMKPTDSPCDIKLHSTFAKNPVWQDVPDPYYGGREHFDMAFDLIENGVDGLLEILERHNSL